MTASLAQQPQARTPFADAVLRLHRESKHGDPIVSFHALPWSQGRSLTGAGDLLDKYRLLFGNDYLASEVAYSGAALDSFFRPTACLDLAQQFAAEAFGSDQTFFVTCGTTVANSVAFDALAEDGKRVLLDRTSVCAGALVGRGQLGLRLGLGRHPLQPYRQGGSARAAGGGVHRIRPIQPAPAGERSSGG